MEVKKIDLANGSKLFFYVTEEGETLISLLPVLRCIYSVPQIVAETYSMYVENTKTVQKSNMDIIVIPASEEAVKAAITNLEVRAKHNANKNRIEIVVEAIAAFLRGDERIKPLDAPVVRIRPQIVRTPPATPKVAAAPVVPASDKDSLKKKVVGLNNLNQLLPAQQETVEIAAPAPMEVAPVAIVPDIPSPTNVAKSKLVPSSFTSNDQLEANAAAYANYLEKNNKDIPVFVKEKPESKPIELYKDLNPMYSKEMVFKYANTYLPITFYLDDKDMILYFDVLSLARSICRITQLSTMLADVKDLVVQYNFDTALIRFSDYVNVCESIITKLDEKAAITKARKLSTISKRQFSNEKLTVEDMQTFIAQTHSVISVATQEHVKDVAAVLRNLRKNINLFLEENDVKQERHD